MLDLRKNLSLNAVCDVFVYIASKSEVTQGGSKAITSTSRLTWTSSKKSYALRVSHQMQRNKGFAGEGVGNRVSPEHQGTGGSGLGAGTYPAT